MAATTIYAVIEELLTRIEAITPDLEQHTKFERADDELDFRAWVEANETQFRVFTIYDKGIKLQGEATGGGEEYETREIEVLIAYPTDTRYGSAGFRSQQKVMAQDEWDIDDEIGHRGAANYTLDAVGVREDTDEEQIDNVTLKVLMYDITYWRAAS